MTAWKLRDRKSVPADAAFLAWTSGDLDRMVAAIDEPTHPLDRHYLQIHIVNQSYKRRAEPGMAALCERTARMHISEFPKLAGVLREHLRGEIGNVSSFQRLATVLTERADFAAAIDVCRQAMAYGLTDGTKGGYEKRIEKIAKVREQRGRDV